MDKFMLSPSVIERLRKTQVELKDLSPDVQSLLTAVASLLPDFVAFQSDIRQRISANEERVERESQNLKDLQESAGFQAVQRDLEDSREQIWALEKSLKAHKIDVKAKLDKVALDIESLDTAIAVNHEKEYGRNSDIEKLRDIIKLDMELQAADERDRRTLGLFGAKNHTVTLDKHCLGCSG